MESGAKVALVTGSSSGIGESTVKLLSRQGYKVAVTGSNPEKVARVVEECAKLSPEKFQPLSLVLDFSQPENGELAVQETIKHFGKLDVLVNNAGVFFRSDGNNPDTYDAYRKLMAINLDSAVQASLAAVEQLKKSKGKLIFVSSVASVKPVEKCYAYCMSKAAMSSFAKCLAIDLAPHVRVNIVSPGPVQTPIFQRIGLKMEMLNDLMGVTTLQERIANSDEIASAIGFLLSDEASFVHGHEMFVDGGYLLRPSTHSVSQQIIKSLPKKD